jgi:hypothetical protein
LVFKWVTVIAITLSAVCCLSANAHQKASQRITADVQFLATSTSTRSSLGESQDVYLVKITLQHDSRQITLARLIDEYPSYRVAITLDSLRSDTPSRMRLRRDDECDVSYSEMPLRTAPGDPTAILPERLGFQPSFQASLAPDSILPCYRTVR